MEDLKAKVDELAELMEQFQLGEAELSGEGWRVAFRKRSAVAATPQLLTSAPIQEEATEEETPTAPAAPAAPQGTPVTSPMAGIFYSASSPSAPPFVKEGEPVSAGQVVGLIEAMKVFNEIVAPTSGRVLKLTAESGQLVNPGDPLLYIG